MTRDIGKVLAGSVALSGSMTRNIVTNLSATLAPAGGFAKDIATTLEGSTLHVAGSLQRSIGKTLAGSITMVGAMGRQGKRLSVNLSSTITPSGSLSKGISHNMASTLSAAGSLSTNLILSLVRALFQARPRAFWFVPSTTYVFDVPPGAGMTAIQTDQGDVVIRTLEKNIGFRLNLGNWLDAGETVSTASATVSAVLQSDPTVDMSANAAAMLQSVVINNPVVTVRLGNQNAVLNAVYTVTISITTSMGRVYQESLPPITCDQ